MAELGVLVIGGSAGSLGVIIGILSKIDTELLFPVIIVLHRKNSGVSDLVGVLSYKTNQRVKEAEEKEPILPGVFYVAPADYHLLVENDCSFSLDYSEKINFSRPSIDVTFQSIADAYKEKCAFVLLSGSNEDGVEGLKYAKAMGGTLIVQSPESAQIPYMPEKAIKYAPVDHIIHANELADFIKNL